MISIDRQILKRMTVYYPDDTPLEISDYLTNVSIDYGDTSGIGVSGVDGVVPIMSFGLKNDTLYRFNPLDKNSPVNQLSGAYVPLIWENRKVLFEARILDGLSNIFQEFLGTGDGSNKDFYFEHYPILNKLNLPLKAITFWQYSELENTPYSELSGLSWFKTETNYLRNYTFDNDTGKISFVESVPADINLVCLVYAYWQNDSGWSKRFRGYLGDDIQNDYSGVSCTCRSTSKKLQDCFIEVEREYGSESGTAAETVIQAIIDDNLGSGIFTLYCPITPGFMVKPYKLSYKSVWDAIQEVASQFGWFLGDYYDNLTNDWYLTLIEPPRTKDSETADLTLDYRTDIKIEELNITGKNIRNAITVIYKDSATGIRDSVTVTDTDSITAYDRRASTFEESDTSLIDTEAEATTFANAALSDLSSLSGAYRVTMPILFDVNLFSGMVLQYPQMHTDNQFFAVASLRESYNFGDSPMFEMELLGSGKVVGGTRKWLDKEARPGAKPPKLPPGINFSGGELKTSAGVVINGVDGSMKDPSGYLVVDSGGFNGKTIIKRNLSDANAVDNISIYAGSYTVLAGRELVANVQPVSYWTYPNSSSSKTLKRIMNQVGNFSISFYHDGGFVSNGFCPAGTYTNLYAEINHYSQVEYHYTDATYEILTLNFSCNYEVRNLID